MYRETISWRRSFNLKQVMSDYGTGEDYSVNGTRLSLGPWRWRWQPSSDAARHVAPYIFFGRLSQAAPDGSPVLVWRAGQADYSGFVREELVSEMIRGFVAHFEDALQSCRSATRERKRLVRARVVVDASNFDLENLRYLQVLRHIMRLVQEHFPEVSATVTVVRAHWSVVALYEILKPWLTEHVQQKVAFLADDFQEGLRAHSGLELSMLPQFLGGLVPDEEAGEARMAAVRWRTDSISSDISWDATRAAVANRSTAQRFAKGSRLTVRQEDCRRLCSIADGSVDALVADVPFGNRNRMVWVNGLLPDFVAEMARVLRAPGRAVLLLTRQHARQVQQLGEETKEYAPAFCKSMATALIRAIDACPVNDQMPVLCEKGHHKVTVGGWPAAVLVFERLDGDGRTTVRSAPALAMGNSATASREPKDCVLIHHGEEADVPLTDFLLQRWPSFFSTSSVARRTVARGRVWMAEDVVQSGAPGAELGPLRQAWWSDLDVDWVDWGESIKGKTILFVPDYPRRSPHETKLVVLWEDDHLAVVVKEPGLRLFGGIRTLANMLAAKEEGASLHPSKEEDALPAPVPLHFLEAEIGGCVLVAKTARAALQGLSSPSRCFQGLFVTGGVLWDEAKLLAATGWTLRRMEPSVARI
ncbi:unnamed protein product [Cladocopium goreaui]|uniref:CRAL-TRIO domain-containing protein T23G5.2 n=1 Tax=Cladocopium goreaui TaxID=2562237 RepID=A0A9P1G6L8_9DINO|nr:unnamed protein product [Cladocopium goreaui]